MITGTAEIAARIARGRGVVVQHGVTPDSLFGLLISTQYGASEMHRCGLAALTPQT